MFSLENVVLKRQPSSSIYGTRISKPQLLMFNPCSVAVRLGVDAEPRVRAFVLWQTQSLLIAGALSPQSGG